MRTVQRKLEEHRGHPKERQPRRLPSGGPAVAREALSGPAQKAALAAAAKNLADAKKQPGAAAEAGNAQTASIIAEHEQAATSAELGTLMDENNSTSDGSAVIDPTESESAGVQRADEGFLIVPTSVPAPKEPVVEGEILSDQVRGANATLGSVFNPMADKTDIESTLQDILKEFILPMLDQHPYMQVDTPHRPKLQLTVSFNRAGMARICVGDWVEYRGGDARLTKQIGVEAALGRVVQADAFALPRVTWCSGTKWLKPFSLFNQEAVHVLFADQAASAYPAAFNSYSEPTPSKPSTPITTLEADVIASSTPSAVAALAASAGAHDMEAARENPVPPNAVSPSPAENLVEFNSPVPLHGSAAQHGETTCTQLVPGNKYPVRPLLLAGTASTKDVRGPPCICL